jgi:hypothetical protein
VFISFITANFFELIFALCTLLAIAALLSYGAEASIRAIPSFGYWANYFRDNFAAAFRMWADFFYQIVFTLGIGGAILLILLSPH